MVSICRLADCPFFFILVSITFMQIALWNKFSFLQTCGIELSNTRQRKLAVGVAGYLQVKN